MVMPLDVISKRLKREEREGHEEKEERVNHGRHEKTRNEEVWRRLERLRYWFEGTFCFRQLFNLEFPSFAKFVGGVECCFLS
jgi:hypothetical protein